MGFSIIRYNYGDLLELRMFRYCIFSLIIFTLIIGSYQRVFN